MIQKHMDSFFITINKKKEDVGANASRLVYLEVLSKGKLSSDCFHLLKNGRLSVEYNKEEIDVGDLLERRWVK